VMIDTRFPVDVASMPEGVEQRAYVDSWKRKTPA
jgi:homogentisate 1,2-dioxygenase